MNGGKIIVSLRVTSLAQLQRDIVSAQDCADLIELRMDYFDSDPSTLLGRLPSSEKPYLLTLRPKTQGGHREITEGERSAFWETVRTRGPLDRLIDVEYDYDLDNDGIEIVSYHNFEGVPPDLKSVYHDLLRAAQNRTLKVACLVQRITDAIPVWRLLENAKVDGVDVVPVAMGEAGEWTRILGLAHGVRFTYAALHRKDATAAGQLTARGLIERYRVKDLTKATKVYGVIGDPVLSSLSPIFQNAAFHHTGEDAVFIRLPVTDLDEFLRRMVVKNTREVELNFAGFSVTMPHKRAIIPYLDEVDETARAIGAVNTVKIESDRFTGYNTDARGFIEPLKRRIAELNGVRVAIIGAGGAARACAYALRQENAEVTVFSRDLEKAEMLGAEVRKFSALQREMKGFDLIVNATPIGMAQHDGVIASADELRGLKLVYDLVTSRDETPLICEAGLAGIETISGTEMLLEQGALQFEIWTGREAPRDAMAQALMN